MPAMRAVNETRIEPNPSVFLEWPSETRGPIIERKQLQTQPAQFDRTYCHPSISREKQSKTLWQWTNRLVLPRRARELRQFRRVETGEALTNERALW